MFRIRSVRQIIGFVVAIMLTITGIMLTTGVLVPIFITTERMQLMFGITVILFGVFRFVSAYFAVKRERKWIEDESWKGQSSDTPSSDSPPPL